jgi:hypothetical protein
MSRTHRPYPPPLRGGMALLEPLLASPERHDQPPKVDIHAFVGRFLRCAVIRQHL